MRFQGLDTKKLYIYNKNKVSLNERNECMKKAQKIILIVCLILILLGIGIAIWCSAPKTLPMVDDKQGEKVDNTNDIITISGDEVQLNLTKKVGDIEISDIKINLIEKNNCKVETKVKNTGDKFLEATNVELKAIDENGVDEIFGGLITALAPQEESIFVTYVLSDIRDIKDIEITAIEE